MFHRCDTIVADLKGSAKKKKLRHGGARGSSSRVAMPNPLTNGAKRNTHSDPPPIPLGAKKVDATSPFLTPTHKERGKKMFFHVLDLGFVHFTGENVKHHTLSMQVFSCSSQRL